MKPFRSIVTVGSLLVITVSCQKKTEAPANCFGDGQATRQVVDKPASVFTANGHYFLVEQGTIDTKLYPCDLPHAFRVVGLQVIISGEVKSSNTSLGSPCCVENFVITKITR